MRRLVLWGLVACAGLLGLFKLVELLTVLRSLTT